MTRSDRLLAMGISYVVNPLVLPPVLIAVLLRDSGASSLETIQVSGVFAVLLTLLPAFFLWWMVRSGRAETVDVPDRRSRLLPYLFGAACGGLVLLYAANGVFTAAGLVFSIALCLLANTAIMMLINRRWKISIHAAGIAGFVGLLLTVAIIRTGEAPLYMIWLALAAPVVMWARIRAGAHTRSEVLAGGLFGLLAPPAEMLTLHVAGIW